MPRPRREKDHEADLAMGAALKERRLKLRMTMADVGRALGWRYQQIQRYENGSIPLSFSKLTELAAVLKASPDEIVAGASGARPDFGPRVERSMFRIALKLTKVPERKREGAVAAMLAMLDAYVEGLPEED